MIIKKFTWPAELTLTLIGGKWKALILHHLLAGENRRFGELRRLLPGISAKMLAKHLKELETDGLITRMETAPAREGGMPRIFYTPTTRSRSLAPILSAIQAWGRDHLVDYEAIEGGEPGKVEFSPSHGGQEKAPGKDGSLRPSAGTAGRDSVERPSPGLSPRPWPTPR
jgi:DNA-binding HxlR family transcriptional regulator